MTSETVEPLSYSSSNELLSCQQKYVYRKVQKVDRDVDAPMDTLAMDIGSTLHKCLEDCNHDLTGFEVETLFKVMKAYQVPSEQGPMLWAMLRKYKELHLSSDVTCVSVEEEKKDEDYIGYVDAIMKDRDGGLWITDLKTAAKISPFLTSRLPRDRQLNIYLHKLGKEKFKGCKYRVVTKSTLKRRKDESFDYYSDRVYERIKAVEYTIPIELMTPDEEGERFKDLRNIQVDLWKGKKPIRNFQNCDSYFRPCEYWSKCHGQIYSDEPKITEISI